jgi:hypothetical protein
VPPHSVSAPGTALGLLPQQSPILRPGQPYYTETALKPKRNQNEPSFDSVVRSELPARNLRSLPFGPTRNPTWMRRPGQQWSRPAARRSEWSGPYGEEFALDKSASALSRTQAELLTACVSGTSRRNVLGAIASAKNDCNFPQRSDDNRGGAPQVTIGFRITYGAKEQQAYEPMRFRCARTEGRTASA